ncbi:MAG: hypothetical protein WCA90_10355 [Ilumatobacteraceae bacterium]|jgi:hypothetical protein
MPAKVLRHEEAGMQRYVTHVDRTTERRCAWVGGEHLAGSPSGLDLIRWRRHACPESAFGTVGK